MFLDHAECALSTSSDWAERNADWERFAVSVRPARKLRQRNPAPLILCGHGVSLRVEGGALAVRDGYTHYPQEQRMHRLFPGDLALPPRIILLDGGGTLSFDVLSWLAEQGIPLARVKWTGEVAIVASGTGYAADAAKVRWQRETAANAAARLAFSVDIIGRKLIASAATLKAHLPPSRKRDDAIAKIRDRAEHLRTNDTSDTTAARAIEGECAAAYFSAWEGLTINWKGTERRPIPDAWREFGSRSSLANGAKPKNYNASHPVNALLNYAYTVKLAHVHIQAVADGYDPTVGILHQGRRGKPAFAFDLIEPERPIVDAAVLQLISERRFVTADFVLRSDGVCRLSPQLARAVATLVSATGQGEFKHPLPGRKGARHKSPTEGASDRQSGPV